MGSLRSIKRGSDSKILQNKGFKADAFLCKALGANPAEGGGGGSGSFTSEDLRKTSYLLSGRQVRYYCFRLLEDGQNTIDRPMQARSSLMKQAIKGIKKFSFRLH